jgi:arsenical pump membrane protein
MAYALLGIIIFSVLAIVTSHRFHIEKQLATRFGIDRDWWVPPLALIIAISLSLVKPETLPTIFLEKIDIIVLIFSFGILSEGLRESGFFTHLAYRIANYADGNTNRLIIYTFILTSVATYFTSNDIVIIVLTPIIIEICRQSNIKNMKLILLSQFIAANTLSMGLLIGSPTNIIISETLNIDFFTYLTLMSAPALIAFTTSLAIVIAITKYTHKIPLPFFQSLTPPTTYTTPKTNPEPTFTKNMRNWILIFTTFLTLVAITTYLQLSLLYCAIPSITIAAIYLTHSNNHTNIKKPLKNLPYGILFFGLTFFTFANALANTQLTTQTIIPTIQTTIQTHPETTPLIGTLGSALLVNITNDLPAAAIIAETLPHLPTTKTTLTQSTLIGLNTGTYLTQIGALAGIIWFSQLHTHTTPNTQLPTRTDLLKYGLIHFTTTTLTTTTYLLLT